MTTTTATTTAEIFTTLLDNLKVGPRHEKIRDRRDTIAKVLNKEFYEVEDSTAHQMMIGSYGRHTAINGVSDLDMVFILPAKIQEDYQDDQGPKRILTRVKNALVTHYAQTDIRVDQCVVRVSFADGSAFEVQPVFEGEDKTFSYPDTGFQRWRIVDPRREIEATRECNEVTRGKMRALARMVRAWKNTCGVPMGGLLIDTLVYRFFNTTSDYGNVGVGAYDGMVRDFFAFLADQEDQDFYKALGSGQRIGVHGRFQPRARTAYNRCVEAIEQEGRTSANRTWRDVFGRKVPLATSADKKAATTEEFIEDRFPVDIRYHLSIDCIVEQKGFQRRHLREMLNRCMLLPVRKSLDFVIDECDVPGAYDVWWKVLNRGPEAERRNMIRGQLIRSNNKVRDGRRVHHEISDFNGDHLVECYIVKDGVVVARDRIDAPIDCRAA